MEDELLKLYNAVSPKFNIGSYEAFTAKMQTPEQRSNFYDVVSMKGFSLGDKLVYENRLKKKEEAVQAPTKPTVQSIEQPAAPIQKNIQNLPLDSKGVPKFLDFDVLTKDSPISSVTEKPKTITDDFVKIEKNKEPAIKVNNIDEIDETLNKVDRETFIGSSLRGINNFIGKLTDNPFYGHLGIREIADEQDRKVAKANKTNDAISNAITDYGSTNLGDLMTLKARYEQEEKNIAQSIEKNKFGSIKEVLAKSSKNKEKLEIINTIASELDRKNLNDFDSWQQKWHPEVHKDFLEKQKAISGEKLTLHNEEHQLKKYDFDLKKSLLVSKDLEKNPIEYVDKDGLKKGGTVKEANDESQKIITEVNQYIDILNKVDPKSFTKQTQIDAYNNLVEKVKNNQLVLNNIQSQPNYKLYEDVADKYNITKDNYLKLVTGDTVLGKKFKENIEKQKTVDLAYLNENFIGKGADLAIDLGGTFINGIIGLASSATKGGKYDIFEKVTDNVMDFVSKGSLLPTQLTRSYVDKSVDYNGNTYIQDENNNITSIRDANTNIELSGYEYQNAISTWNNLPEKPIATKNFNSKNIIGKTVKSIGDMYMLIGGGRALTKGLSSIKTLSTAPKLTQAVGLTASGMVMEYNDLYNQAIATGEISKADASKFAAATSFYVASLENISPQTALFGSTAKKSLTRAAVEVIKNGGTIKQAVKEAVKSQVKDIAPEIVQELTQEVADRHAKSIFNSAYNKEVFDTSITSSEVADIVVATALTTFFASSKSSAKAFTNMNALQRDAITTLMNEPNFDKYSQIVEKEVLAGRFSRLEADKAIKAFSNIKAVQSQIDDNQVSEKDKPLIVSLMSEKLDLERERDTKDSAFQDTYNEKIGLLDNIIQTTINKTKKREAILEDVSKFNKQAANLLQDQQRQKGIENVEISQKQITEKAKELYIADRNRTEAKAQQFTPEITTAPISTTVETPTVETPTVETPTVETPTVETPMVKISKIEQQKAQNTPINKIVDDNNIYIYDGKKGIITTDGKVVVFETKDEIIELGSRGELGNKKLGELNITRQQPLKIDINEDNSVVLNGKTYTNKFAIPEKAIKKTKDGYSITLFNENGQQRTFRGQQAESIIYQYKLKKNDLKNVAKTGVSAIATTPTVIAPTTAKAVETVAEKTVASTKEKTEQATKPKKNEPVQTTKTATKTKVNEVLSAKSPKAVSYQSTESTAQKSPKLVKVKQTPVEVMEKKPIEYANNPDLINERIQAAVITPTAEPLPKNLILAKVVRKLKAKVIYSKTSRGASGSYFPGSTLIKIRSANNFSTAIHEIGHLLDDRFGIFESILGSADKNKMLESLDWFSERGGSNPSPNMSEEQQMKYLKREGIAEFTRAYALNPAATKAQAPELFKHFENYVNQQTLKIIQEFSQDVLNLENAPAHEKIMSSIHESTFSKLKKYRWEEFREWFNTMRTPTDIFNVSGWDKVQVYFSDSMKVANKAFEFAQGLNSNNRRMTSEENFTLLSRIFAGINGQTTRMVENGLTDGRNHRVLDNGMAINIEYLFAPLDTTSKKAMNAEIELTMTFLKAERTFEYVKKFGRIDQLTDIGITNTDLEVASDRLKDHDKLKQTNPDKAKRIEEAARRYRVFADTGLKYAVDKGRLSQDQYDLIKASNQYYVNLTRLKEIAPGEELTPFMSATNQVSAVKEPIKKAKGGSGMSLDPYQSLISTTINIIKESDRNAIMEAFVEPLINYRDMGEGTPKNLAQIGRKVSSGEVNTIKIYKDGEIQYWQFEQDIHDALKGLSGIGTDNLLLKALQAPANLIRFTVTHFPVFALKNSVRDTVARLIESRTKGKISDLAHTKLQREEFELFGGSQGGFHLTSKNEYREAMKNAVLTLTKNGNIIIDPRKISAKNFYNNYEKFLQRGENLNRIAEYKSAYRSALKQGMDEYNAGLYAAFQARDLMDFAVAGTWMREINKYIPFANASVQAVKRAVKGIRENPATFAYRTALYTVIPQLFFRGLVIAQGDDDEYNQLPDWQRDLFWNFKTPFTGDIWCSIPKPFELGLPASMIDRGISYHLGFKEAWDGAFFSVWKTIFPFDEVSFLGSLKPFVETATNYDLFRNKDIVSYYEKDLLLNRRKGTKYASRVGQQLTKAFGFIGMEVDPRNIDHIIKGYTTYVGDWALSIGDIGKEDSRFKFDARKTGFAREPAIGSAKVVKKAEELAKKIGMSSQWYMKDLRTMQKEYYNLDDDEKTKKILRKEIYTYAEKILEELKLTKQEQDTELELEELSPSQAED